MVVVVGSFIILLPRILWALLRRDGAESDSCVPAPARRAGLTLPFDSGFFYSADDSSRP
jgi:hypothetical protein